LLIIIYFISLLYQKVIKPIAYIQIPNIGI